MMWVFRAVSVVRSSPADFNNAWNCRHSRLLAPLHQLRSGGADQEVTDSDDSGDEPVTRDGTGSSDVDGLIVSLVWQLDGNQIAIGANPTYDFPVGVHIVELTVTDDEGATDTDTVPITVLAPANQPPSIDPIADQSNTVGDAVAYRQAITVAGRLIDGGLWDGESQIRFEDVYATAKKIKGLSDKEIGSLFTLKEFVQMG